MIFLQKNIFLISWNWNEEKLAYTIIEIGQQLLC